LRWRRAESFGILPPTQLINLPSTGTAATAGKFMLRCGKPASIATAVHASARPWNFNPAGLFVISSALAGSRRISRIFPISGDSQATVAE
jgi:hypothetical protein